MYFNGIFNSFQGVISGTRMFMRIIDLPAVLPELLGEPTCRIPGGGERLAASRSGRTAGHPRWQQPTCLPALDPTDICSAYSCQYFFQLCAPVTFGSAKV